MNAQNPTLYGFGNPSPDEQAYIELINAARANPPTEGALLAATNDPYALAAYTQYGVNLTQMQTEFNAIPALPPLAPSANLTISSRGHSTWMFNNQTQSHNETNPANTYDQRITATGYVWSTVGENLFCYSQRVWHGHAGFEVDWGTGGTYGMQAGRVHRANIHNPSFREIGVGVVNGTNGTIGPQIVTQNFGTQQSDPTLGTGVAYYDLNGNNTYDSGEGISGLTVNVSDASYYCTTADGGGWAVPLPSSAATRTVTFTGLNINQSVPLVVPASTNAKADLKLTYNPPAITSPASATAGSPYAINFSTVGGATGYKWNIWNYAAAPAENCESTANITSTTTGTYAVLDTTTKQQGNASFHLADSTFASQYIYLNTLYLGQAGSTISFQSRLGYATTAEYAKVQVQEVNTSTWQDVYSQQGTTSPGESGFTLRTASLAAMQGKVFRIRFLLYYTAGGSTYNNTADNFGWLIDAISFGNLPALSNNVLQRLSSTTGSFNPSAGIYLMSVSPTISGNDFPASLLVLNVSQSQSITFGTLPNKTYGDAPFALTATTTSGLAVSYSSSNPAVATVSGNTVTITGSGTTTITASQAGDANYGPATSVAQTLTVLSTSKLSLLTLSSGTLSPAFTSGITSYTASVTYDIATATITPTAMEPTATVRVNGASVASGTTSTAIPLTVGTNTITTVVTTQDGTSTQIYTVIVTRAAASTVATLSSLTISSGTLSPTFAATTTSYNASVIYPTSSMVVTPTLTDTTATIKVNGTTVASGAASSAISLGVGSNTISIVVTAQDGASTQSYTVIVTRAAASHVTTLSSLALSSGTLSPAFASAATSYTASVYHSTTLMMVTPTLTDITATIKVNGTTVTSGAASSAISLGVGSNTISIVVTAQDGTSTKTYTVTVTRSADNDAFSKPVSFQYLDSLDDSPSTSPIVSQVVSYQYFDWPGDENLTFTNSPSVSYYFNGPPQIVTQPSSQLLKVGATATLSVVAYGTPPLNYQWRYNGQPLPDTGGASIALDNLQTGDSGVYSVVVSNTSGSVTSSDARLIVYAAPATPQPNPPALVTATDTPSAAQTLRPRVPSSAQLKVLSGTTIDPNKMTIVMTHGWNSSSADWPTSMAAALSSTYGSKANILAWDWRNNAADPSPAAAASRTVSEGTALGNALMDSLGPTYNKPIHFIGHSLGTLVDCAAADYIHGDRRPRGDARAGTQKYASTNTHMTLFDEAELVTAVKGLHVMGDILLAAFDDYAARDGAQQIRNFWSKVIPDNWAWVDNYISEVGLPHVECANVMLWRKNYVNVLLAPHGYAYEWYQSTITNPLSSTMGHRWSFERDSLLQAPIAPAYYLQSLDLNASEMTVNPTNLVTAQSLSWGRVIAYPTLKSAQGLNALAATVPALASSAIQYAGNMATNIAELFSMPNSTPAYLGSADSTAAYFTAAGQTGGSNLQSSWDLQFSIQQGTLQPQHIQAGLQTMSVNALSTGPVYTIIPVHVPNEAVGVSFEYSISGAAADEFMTMGINTSNEFTMEAKFLDDGAWNGTPVIPISDHRNQDVQLVFALNGVSASPTGTLSVRNIQFYIPPRPQLTLNSAGNSLTVAWPLSATDWTLESNPDLLDPNGWLPVTEPPNDTDFFHTMMFDISGTQRGFFRLKK